MKKIKKRKDKLKRIEIGCARPRWRNTSISELAHKYASGKLTQALKKI
jgi:hypothetical protein